MTARTDTERMTCGNVTIVKANDVCFGGATGETRVAGPSGAG